MKIREPKLLFQKGATAGQDSTNTAELMTHSNSEQFDTEQFL